MLALVALFGMIFVGAAVVIISGGYLIDSVQGSSQHELAKDSAIQTHESISEALQSGEARALGVGDDVDMTVLESGSISIEMTDASGGGCAANGVVGPVEADLGAIVYDTPKGEIVYQGGAVWERTDGGLSAVRAPPISYDNETTRISIQTVAADADTFEDRMARPNETMQTAMAKETDRMLTECPANGYRNVEIAVTSPNYADLWKRHFDERVDTGPGVEVRRSGDRVVANITNATSPHSTRGLRFANISAPDVVSNQPEMDGELAIDAKIANDGFSAREARTRVRIAADDGTTLEFESPATRINPARERWANVSDRGLQYDQLIAHPDLTDGQRYSYTVEIVDSADNVVSTVPGEFFLADFGGGELTMVPPDHELDAAHKELTINATLYNTLITNETTDVSLNITDERVDLDTGPKSVDIAGYGGVTEVNYGPVNVSSLPAGLYEYEVEGPDGPISSEFAISNRSQSNLAGNLLLESIDAPARIEHENGSFDVTGSVVNLGPDDSSPAEIDIDIEGGPHVPPGDVPPIGTHNTTSEQASISESTLSTLQVGNVYNYTVTLNGADGTTNPIDGSFYIGNPGPYPVIENTTADGENATISATLSNHGLENVTDTAASLTFYGQDGTPLGSRSSDEYHLEPNETLTTTFDLETSGLTGTYEYRIDFGNATENGTITFDSVDGGGDDVTITAPGNGTVTVLGTEVSNSNWFGDKDWAPVSVASILTIDGDRSRHQFYNNATDDPESLYDMRNLNSYDTQEETYSHNWTQVEGETAELTISSTLWQQQTYGFEPVGGDNYHPPESAWDDPYNEVNADAGTNSSNVRVLLDGDQVPNVHAAGDEQRSAAEILNQGAAERVDDDGNLNLGRHEAIFLVELSDRNADWEDADESEGDPDYNDVIVLVGFNPDNPESVDFSVSEGGSDLIFGSGPDTGDTGDSEEIDGIGTNVDGDSSTSPSPPNTSSPDPGSPSEPDEIDVDVGGVVIG